LIDNEDLMELLQFIQLLLKIKLVYTKIKFCSYKRLTLL